MDQKIIDTIRDIEKSIYSANGFVIEKPNFPNQWVCQGQNTAIYLEWSQKNKEVFAPYFSVQVDNQSRYSTQALSQLGLSLSEIGNNLEELTQTVRFSKEDLILLQSGIRVRQLLKNSDMTYRRGEIIVFETELEKARFMDSLIRAETKDEMRFYPATFGEPQIESDGLLNLNVHWSKKAPYQPSFSAFPHRPDYTAEDSDGLEDIAGSLLHTAKMMKVFQFLDLELSENEFRSWVEELKEGQDLGAPLQEEMEVTL